MSRMELAATRLDKALERLEDAARPLVRAHAEAREAIEKLHILTQERDRLNAEVADLESRCQHLSELNAQAEERLDSAISEIRAALGR